VLDTLRDYVRDGIPVVGMEPSCLAVFKDELVKLLPHDDDAKRLAASACHFGEFFTRYDISPPALAGQALLWGHCHHRATGGIDPEQQVLTRMGLDVQPLSGGCCGLAGSWGFEQGKYDISMDCGEQALLPAVRAADAGTLVVANGFSCKTQIEDAETGRRALHLAEVMQLARDGAAGDPPDGPPEQRAAGRPKPPARRRLARRAALAATAGAAALAARAVSKAR
jgi:Fe-S oxidoreductase